MHWFRPYPRRSPWWRHSEELRGVQSANGARGPSAVSAPSGDVSCAHTNSSSALRLWAVHLVHAVTPTRKRADSLAAAHAASSTWADPNELSQIETCDPVRRL
jgi:hypothetical protein